MRYGVIADVHGNLPALRAAIDRLTRLGVERWLCAGDLVGYGPQPNECVEAVAGLGALCVAGNHEALVLRRDGDGPPDASIAWTRTALRDDCRAYIAGLPRLVTAPGLVMAHAALEDGRRYVRSDEDAADQLRRLEASHPGARVLVLGHTHLQRAYEQRGGARAVGRGPVRLDCPRFLLNPGAVGQSRQRELVPRARFMLLDLEAGEATLLRAPYDRAAVRRALRAEGLPPDVIHLAPRSPGVRRRARRLARRRAGQTSPVR